VHGGGFQLRVKVDLGLEVRFWLDGDGFCPLRPSGHSGL
jgi:hypothetical protein